MRVALAIMIHYKMIVIQLLDTLKMLRDYNFWTIAMTCIALCFLLSGSPDRNDLP